jgi:hypothetical protein
MLPTRNREGNEDPGDWGPASPRYANDLPLEAEPVANRRK